MKTITTLFLIALISMLFFRCGGTYYASPLTEKIEILRMETGALQAELDECRIQRTACERDIFASKVKKKVTVTCYQSKPEQTDSTPFIGAFNTRVGHGTIAVSQDLLKSGIKPFSRVYLEGLGVFTVEDVMHPKWKNRVDIWIPNDAKPFKYEAVNLISYNEKDYNS